jgi:hypothetical protein
MKTKGRPLQVMAHLKRSIIELKGTENCLAHALVIAIAKIRNKPNHNSYRWGLKIHPADHALLEDTGLKLRNGGGIPYLIRFQEHFPEFMIVVYSGLNCESIMFDGRVEASTGINLLYDDVTRHYHAINNLTRALAKRFICEACNKVCKRGVTRRYDVTCNDCM